MTRNDLTSRRISVLRDDVAKKIAAGEVIDRPFSVLRELIDNAIDSGANRIEVDVLKGGIESISVYDNGVGMPPEDVKLCWMRHATSKLSHEDDLYAIQTLGFRGEALASISSVSKFELSSRDELSPGGTRLTIDGGGPPRYSQIPMARGTRVSVRDLFYNLPARRHFIKSPRAESSLCRRTVVEKALAHPGIHFVYTSDDVVKLNLPALLPESPTDIFQASESDNTIPQTLHPSHGEAFKQRVAAIYEETLQPAFLHSVKGSGEHFRFDAVIGLPPLTRNDRKYLQIYCNSRRIDEYSLQHAIEYAFSPILPGGTFPVGFLFLEIDPDQVDVNIHPAKREVRFVDPHQLHSSIRRTIEEFISFYSRRKPQPLTAVQYELGGSTAVPPASHETQSETHYDTNDKPTNAIQANPSYADSPQVSSAQPVYHRNPVYIPRQHETNLPETIHNSREGIPPYRYLGQIFRLFLLAEIGDELYIIDMHAAHERILFDRFRASPTTERLLLPLELENDDADAITRRRELATGLNTIGFEATCLEDGTIHINSVPSRLSGRESILQNVINDLGTDTADIEHNLYENMACRTAVKDGDLLDDITACRIIEDSWLLPVKRCPHGRPIWYSLSKGELFQLLGRTV